MVFAVHTEMIWHSGFTGGLRANAASHLVVLPVLWPEGKAVNTECTSRHLTANIQHSEDTASSPWLPSNLQLQTPASKEIKKNTESKRQDVWKELNILSKGTFQSWRLHCVFGHRRRETNEAVGIIWPNSNKIRAQSYGGGTSAAN